jgi:hypothetical protein
MKPYQIVPCKGGRITLLMVEFLHYSKGFPMHNEAISDSTL